MGRAKYERNLTLDNNENRAYTVLISCVATIGGFLFGFDSGVINGTVDGLQAAFNSDRVGTGFNVASMLLGCAFGAFFAGRLADRFGRRFIMRIAAVFFIVEPPKPYKPSMRGTRRRLLGVWRPIMPKPSAPPKQPSMQNWPPNALWHWQVRAKQLLFIVKPLPGSQLQHAY